MNFLLISITVALAVMAHTVYAGVHHLEHSEPLGETEHHHEVDHKHATSHQTISLHHFHPVPVYVKHDEHPIELKGIKHVLKVLHPETKQHGEHGLTIENHGSEFHGDGGHGGHEGGHEEHSGYSHY